MTIIKRLTIFLIIFLTSAVTGCTPNLVDIGIVPASMKGCEIAAEEALPISLKGTIPADATIEWAATRGVFHPTAGFPTVYTAPADPGPVVITVKVAMNKIVQTYTVNCTVLARKPTPTRTPEPTATPTATRTTSPTPTTTATPTPTATPAPLVLASTESTRGWTLDSSHAYGKAANNSMGQAAGRDGKAVRISYEITEFGSLMFNRALDFQTVLHTSGIRFSYQGGDINGSGANNTIEIRLIFRWPEDHEEVLFDYTINNATNTHGEWKTVTLPYDQFTCQFPAVLCRAHQNTVDLSYITRVELALSNKPDKGDVPGQGFLILEDMFGIK